nr:hypothetical protein [Tanacetum cinerariifolium]
MGQDLAHRLGEDLIRARRGDLRAGDGTVFDASPGYVGLYTHSFSLANLRLPLTEFFCEVLEYFWVHISRLNPFSCAKLTTFVVMWKAYGCEPSLDLFLGLFNLFRAGKWLTFAKRPEKRILNLLPKVITPSKVGTNGFSMFEIPLSLPTTCDHGGRKGNYIYTEDDDDLAFLPNEPSPGFGIGFPSALVNTEPPKDIEEHEVQPVEVTVDSRESSKAGVFVVHPGSVAACIKKRKCKTREGSSRPPVKRKLAFGSLSSRVVRAKSFASNDDALFLSISDDDDGHLDNKIDLELLDLHDRCYARQAVVDNAVNRRAPDMAEFDKNPAVLALREKISSMNADVKEHKGNLDRMMLESQKWAGYQVTLLKLESKVNSLEADKARLEAVEASLRKEVEELKQDMRDVVSNVIPYAAMELVHSDELGRLVGKLVSFAITYGHYRAYEQDHIHASNDFATTTFPWLDEFVVDATTLIKTLISKKCLMLQKPAPSRTQMPLPSSQKATPSSAPSLNPMSPHTDLVKPSLSLLE